MKELNIKPGNIASIALYEGDRYIYMSKGNIEAADVPSPGWSGDEIHITPFEDLDAKVQEALHDHFEKVFDLPVEKRGAYLRAMEVKS